MTNARAIICPLVQIAFSEKRDYRVEEVCTNLEEAFMSQCIPNLSSLSLQTRHPPRQNGLNTGFKTGARRSDREYAAVNIDSIESINQQSVHESNIGAFKQKRFDASISILIRTELSDETLARHLVEIGESISRRVLGYHPEATFDVDVITLQSKNSFEIRLGDEGVEQFREMMSSNLTTKRQLERVMVKRVVAEARMLFLRVPEATQYTLNVTLPEGRSLQEEEFL